MRPQESTPSKEALDRLDGRTSISKDHDKGNNNSSGSRIYSRRENLSHSGQFSVFDPKIANPLLTPTLGSSAATPSGTPERLRSGSIHQIDEFDMLSDIPQLNGSLQPAFHSRRPSFGNIRSPSAIRSDSVLRASVKSLPGSENGTLSTNISEPDPYTPSGNIHSLLASIDIDDVAVGVQNGLDAKDAEAIQQSLLSELNYHYGYARPALPITSSSQTRLDCELEQYQVGILEKVHIIGDKNVNFLTSCNSGTERYQIQLPITPIDNIMSGNHTPISTQILSIENNGDYNTNFKSNSTPQNQTQPNTPNHTTKSSQQPISTTSTHISTVFTIQNSNQGEENLGKSGNNGTIISPSSMLQKSALLCNFYDNDDSYDDDEAEINELNSLLKTTTDTLSSPASNNAQNPNFYTSVEQFSTSQHEISQPLFDRQQFQLAQYAQFQQDYQTISNNAITQLPSRHAYSNIFLPSIYPQPPLQQTMLSNFTNTGLYTNLSSGQTAAAATASTGTALTPLYAAKGQYTWKGSHHRNALKQRRVQVLRFALTETQLLSNEQNNNQQNAANGSNNQTDGGNNGGGGGGSGGGSINGGADDDDDYEDGNQNLLYTHHSTPKKLTPATTSASQTGPRINENVLTVNNSQQAAVAAVAVNDTLSKVALNSSTLPSSSTPTSTQGSNKQPGPVVQFTVPQTSNETPISESEFLYHQNNARKLLARSVVPSPHDIILDINDKDNHGDDKHGLKSTPLAYSVSGVANLDYLAQQLDSRPTKDILRGKKLLSTLTAAYQEDLANNNGAPNVSTDGNLTTPGPKFNERGSLFAMNKARQAEGGGPTGGNSALNTIFSTPPATYQQVTGLAYTTPLKSILVNGYSEQEKQTARQHLLAQQQFEEFCRRRMRQGCYVIKYKHYQPTKRFLYLSHNDTMLSWRELTSKEEKKFALWDSMPEDWKECAVTNEIQMASQGSLGGNIGFPGENGEDNDGQFTNNGPGSGGNVNIINNGSNSNVGNIGNNINEDEPTNTADDDKNEKKNQKQSRWSSFLPNTTSFKSTKHVNLDDIKQIFYGPFVGLGFGPFVDQCRQGNAKPWYAITIQTPVETLNIVFLCNYDVTLWLQGFYSLAPSTGKAFSLGKMLWLRLIMKINFVGYNDFVFGTQQTQSVLNQQQQLQQQRLENDNFDASNTNQNATSLNRASSNLADELPALSNIGMNTAGGVVSTNTQGAVINHGHYTELSRLSVHGSLNVANLKPTTALTMVPQIFAGGPAYDWSEKLSRPGSIDLAKYR
jgi:hypothetical protein